MSTYVSFTSTPFYVAPENADRLAELCDEHFEDYCPDLDSTFVTEEQLDADIEAYELSFSGEAGDSLKERLANYLAAVKDMLLMPVEVVFAEETGGTFPDVDRLYAGPDPEQVELFATQKAMERAMNELYEDGSLLPAVKNLLLQMEAFLKETEIKLVAPPVPA